MLAAAWAFGFAAPRPRAAGLEAHHEPLAPRSGETVRISVQAPPSVTQMVLRYQVVDPGRYIELNDPGYRNNWLSQTMQAKPVSPDTLRFTAELPGKLQTHRRLVRYRFEARDESGARFALPGTNDEVGNFAYFVYDGVPAWSGAATPRKFGLWGGEVDTFDTNVMRRVQSYFLIGKERSIENVTWDEPDRSKQYRYTGTLVVDGVVYDHVRMRARGGGWRFQMGKNMWKFQFAKSQRLQARDDYGRPYPATWNKLNLRGPIQQAHFGHRGEEGMFESVGFRLFNLAGVPAPFTHWIQLRIVTGAEETPADQYRGDFWGLYLAIEDEDGRFLKAHALPDGNIYKMQNGGGTLSHQGQGADPAELRKFLGAYSRTPLSEAWWRQQLDLPEYYSYRAICECIHHYDIGGGKNYDYYRHPIDGRWMVFPWDIDLTWADNMYGDGNEPFRRRVLAQPTLRREYQNRLREIRDLLFNPEEAGRLISECAAIIADPAGGPSPVDADRAKWDYHPRMTSGYAARQGLFYQISPTKDFRGMVRLMQNYVRTRGAWIDATLLNDPEIPATPTLAYTGPPGFPPDQLTFRASDYQGRHPYASIQWRLGETRPAATLRGRPTAPGSYEITPIWESGEQTNGPTTITIPANTVAAGNTYRARVRVKDDTGRWSHWSAPVKLPARSTGPTPNPQER